MWGACGSNTTLSFLNFHSIIHAVLQRQAEKKADEQRRRRERKRKKTGPGEVRGQKPLRVGCFYTMAHFQKECQTGARVGARSRIVWGPFARAKILSLTHKGDVTRADF